MGNVDLKLSDMLRAFKSSRSCRLPDEHPKDPAEKKGKDDEEVERDV